MPGTRAGAYFVTTLSLGRAPAVAGSPGAPFNEGAKGTAAISRTNDLRSIEHPPRFRRPGAGDVTAPRGARSRRRRARRRVRVRLRTPPRATGRTHEEDGAFRDDDAARAAHGGAARGLGLDGGRSQGPEREARAEAQRAEGRLRAAGLLLQTSHDCRPPRRRWLRGDPRDAGGLLLRAERHGDARVRRG